MRYLKLEARVCPLSGMLGLQAESLHVTGSNTPVFEGSLLAHDLLEHQNGIRAIGSVGDEVEAMGGCWFIRGKYGQMRKDMLGSAYSPEEQIAFTIADMCMYHHRGVPMRASTTRTYRHTEDYAFDEILEKTEHYFKDELEHCDDTLNTHLLNEFLIASRHLLRAGYNKAQRRFGTTGSANDQFWAIADAVDSCCEVIDFEGQQFMLRYGNGEALCQEYSPRVYY